MFVFSGPAEVRGRFQKTRDVLHPLLIVFFVILPWIKINNEPMILVDVLNRNFVIFGNAFYSHDAPLLFFLVILLLLSIFIVTAIYGRLWCGWTCPQTVFIQGLFNKLEKFILGSYGQRVLLFRSHDSIQSKTRIIFLFLVFFILSWILAHSFGAYFLGADAVTRFILDGPALHQQSFIVLMILTVVLFLNFTFFRERLCISICPYGRFQNAMIDSNSLIVHYNAERGEPRGKIVNGKSQGGACVDCHRCLTVCPTKIDIRQGFQLECIACARCIDACNEVMAKTHSAPDLIRYQTGNNKPLLFLRFRLFLYLGLFIFFSVFFGWSLNQRKSVEFNWSRSHTVPFGTRFERDIKILQNQIVVHLKNQTDSEQPIKLSMSLESSSKGFKILSPANEMVLRPKEDLKTVAIVEIDDRIYKPESKSVEVMLKTGTIEIKRKMEFIKVD